MKEEFTNLISFFSKVSKLSKDMIEQQQKGVSALERINQTFMNCGDAARSGDPEQVKTALMGMIDMTNDFEKYADTSRNASEIMLMICNEIGHGGQGTPRPQAFENIGGYA